MTNLGLSVNGEGSLSLDFATRNDAVSVEDQVMELFLDMRIPILRHLLWMNLRPDQAEDILQDTFLRLYLQLTQTEFPQRNLRGWTWRVAHNLGVNLRLAMNRKENGTELDLDTISARLVDPSPNPEQTFERSQIEQKVSAGFQKLNERERQCVHLRVQGLGYRQIATVLGIGRSTVADTLDRVTTLLRSYSHPR
jgi:RNA polymerase sigma-70 factor (ECF subfamily)